MLSYSNTICSQTYTLSVGESVNVSQSTYNGGYIDNVGLAAFIDPHLSFAKNYDGSAKITVNSYFDYTATVKLVFIERYQSYYSGRNHTRAATYYKDVSIKCSYVAPKPNVKPTKVLLPERVRVPLDKRVDIYPTYEPYGAKGTKFSWDQWQGTAVFSHGEYNDGGYHVTGRSPGLGEVSVKVDNSLYASTVIEVVDPNNLPPDNVFLPSNIEISVGGHTTLEPILVPEGTSTSYTWSSDNSNIATVSYGKVTGVKVGSTKIIVKTANDLQTTCTVNVVSANGKDDEDDNGTQTTGNIDGHDYIDLGLSVKWATCNVGASKPENFGSYFAWGETSEKSSYSWDNYKYGSNALNCRNIGNDISGTSYDAAYVNWGSNWRMPNEKEMGELISKCTITKATQNGVDGFLVTGPNGNSIFLPTANAKFSTSSSGCRYWTSTVDDYNGRSLFINYSNGKISPTLQGRARPMGLPIRAVTSTKSSTIEPTGLTVSPSSKTIKVGDTFTATYSLTPSNATTTVTWSSDDSSIASVDSKTGLVTGKKAGTTYINATTTNGKTDWCKVAVENNAKLSLSASPSGGSVLSGTEVYLSATVNGSKVSDVKIYYTLDGSEPTTSSNEYKSRITINESCTLNAIATKPGYNDSDVTSWSYAVSKYGIEINATNFPDEAFRNWLLKQDYGKDGILTATEIKSVRSMDVSSCRITSLKGIEFFTNLWTLDCDYNKLTALDVRCNRTLKTLNCSYNQLTTLDVSNCYQLWTLICENNQLKSLEVPDVYLSSFILSCSSNKLTALDVSKAERLISLSCENNQLTALDVSKNTKLTDLMCSNNQLTALDVSKNAALYWLECYGNQIRGQAMDNLISSLPYNSDSKSFLYSIAVFSTGENEGNVCTKAQVAAVKRKGWKPYYYKGTEWLEYEGSDASDVKAIKKDLEADAPIYNLQGPRLAAPQKGINIIGGKKVVVK